jgi:hypothetical protein
MGWFKRYQESVIVKPSGTNTGQVPKGSKGSVTLDEAKRVLRVEPDETIHIDDIWRMRSQDCKGMIGDGYWIGALKMKGNRVGIYVQGKHVGNLDPRSTESGKRCIKSYGSQAVCVISNTAPGSWNVYVDMSK